MKSKKTSGKLSKNQLFKNKVIINYDDLKNKLSSIIGSEDETVQSNIQCSQMLNILFDENKFQFKNNFDRKHCKKFLKEKLQYLEPMNLDDSLSENEKGEILTTITSKFTFGNH